MGFDFIVIAPLLPPRCGFVVFGRGVSFIGGFWHPAINGGSAASCILALSQEECAHVLIRRHLETEVRAMILILPCTVALLGIIRFGEETKFPMPQ